MSREEVSAAGGEFLPQLNPDERMLLWAIRAWSAHHDDPTDIWWSIDRAFSSAGIRPALEPFDALMKCLFSNLLRWPDIRCARCPRLGEDEARLITFIRHLQNDDRVAAAMCLRGLAGGAATRHACHFGQQIAECMSVAGMQLVRRNPAANAEFLADQGM